MSKRLRKSAILWIVLSLFVTTLSFGPKPVSAAAANVPDGVYPVNYTIYHASENSVSVANDYMKTSGEKGSLIIENGIVKFEHTLSAINYTRFPYHGFRLAGKEKAVINNEVVTGMEGYQAVSARPAASGNGSYTVQYVISDLTQMQDLLIHILIPEFSYDHWYNVRLSIDTSTLPGFSDGGNGGGNPTEPEEPTVTKVTYAQLNESISVAHSVYAASKEGTAYGDYPTGSKAALAAVISYAETMAILTPAGDEDAYGSIYNTLTGALKLFQSKRLLADSKELVNFIAILNDFTSKAKSNGTAEGSPGGAAAAITANEYYHSNLNTLNKNIVKAVTAVNTPTTTPQQIANHLTLLSNNYNSVKITQYVAVNPMRIYVLDQLDPTNVQSAYANEIKDTADVIVQKQNTETLHNFLANVTIKGLPANAKVVQSYPTADGAFTIIKSEAYTHYANHAASISSPDGQVHQLSPRGTDASDEDWQGLSYISYDIDGVTRDLYLSFNAEWLDRLKASLSKTELLYESAKKAQGTEQSDFDTAKAELLAAINKAKLTANNLAAARPVIKEAETELLQAAQTFKEHIVYERYFSVLHATNEAFSSADSYFVKPALIETGANGEAMVSLTVKDSSSIKELQVERGGNFEDVAVVSEDEAANTRVVKFAVADLGVLQNAKMRVVVSYAGQTHDQTYSVRFNLNDVNNAALIQMISQATAIHKAAVVGTSIGQYATVDKEALLTAINHAAAIGAKAAGTQLQTDHALVELAQSVETFQGKAVKSIADGDYAIAFRILKYGTNSNSVMHDYVEPSAILKVRGDEKNVYLTLKNHKEITALKFNGQDVKVESIDQAANKRLVSFPVTDLIAITDGWVKIDWPEMNYFHEYDIQLKLDASSLTGILDASALNALIKNARDTYDASVEGDAVGNVKAGSKALLAAAIEEAAAAASSSLSQTQIDGAAAKLQQAIDAFVATKVGQGPGTNPGSGLADGQYAIGVRVLKYGTEQDSVMQEYIFPTAKLVVSGSSKQIHLSIKQDKEITGLKFNGANVALVSRNTEKNTRVVSFAVSDLSKITDGWVKIDWPEMSYFHEYNIQFKFDESSIRPYNGTDDLELIEETDGGKGNEELNEPVVTDFKDIQGHWAQASIEKALKLGIVKGYEDGKFHPNGVITRAEFAALISRALKLPGSTTTTKFNDNKQIPTWAQEHVTRAVQAGLIGGYEDQTFRASNEITRAELAVIIARAAKLETKEDAVLSFADADKFPAWARKEAAAAIEAGLIQGKGNNTFDPNANATRSEALTLILRVLEKL